MKTRLQTQNLPGNPEIELFEEDHGLRLIYHRSSGEPYVSEIYGIPDGEAPASVALRIARRYGWDANPPNSEDTPRKWTPAPVETMTPGRSIYPDGRYSL